MPKFSKSSIAKLSQCHPDLQRLFKEVIKRFDCSVICGYRSQKEQDLAFKNGKSKLQFPKSKHNTNPSNAVDVVPFPIDWDNINRFMFFAGYVLGVADEMGISIRWGGDWNKNYKTEDEKFRDFPHFELL